MIGNSPERTALLVFSPFAEKAKKDERQFIPDVDVDSCSSYFPEDASSWFPTHLQDIKDASGNADSQRHTTTEGTNKRQFKNRPFPSVPNVL